MTEKSLHSGPFGRQDPSLPRVFGRYLLVQRLSRGGMGEIFLAKHGLTGFEKLAVIKKVLPNLAADAQFISRFVDEAQVAIKLQHVNIAQVFEVGRVGDEYFLALEYVEGRDLRRTLSLLGHRKHRMPVDLALFIARELANGLAYAHRRTRSDGSSLHLVHCDISPPNVLVSFEGETKVIDFGIAKSALRGTATDPKLGFGKFGYMAPEQLIRGGVVDARTDIYAAGVVLFELLTNHRLYDAGPEPDYRALAKKVAHGDHALPGELDPLLAPYDDLVATALRPKSQDRYQSAAEFRDAIQQTLVAVNPTISTDQLGTFMRELFNEEMTAQRELHERVASVHLEDFQEQLHTQTISTVSFAAAQLPLLAPPEPAPRAARTTGPRTALVPAPSTHRTNPSGAHRTAPPAPGPPSGPHRAAQPSGPYGAPAQRPSPALDTMAPPTDAIPTTEELSLADGTGTAVSELAAAAKPGRRRRIYALAGGALAVVLAAAVVIATSLGRRSGEPGARPSVASAGSAPEVKKHPEIRVTPIEVPPEPPPTQPPAPATGAAGEGGAPSPKAGSGAGAAAGAGSAAGAGAAAGAGSARPRPARPRPPESPKEPPKEPKKDLTRELVAAKFSSVRREYAAFKGRNGDRLEKEWGDLATFMTYQLTPGNLEDAVRRIESFRAQLRD
ncbi:MAG TPA: serine/threonine-protein kinase [Kofleriaceae bacterium]|nr:serine/threonine-protein kinase [Kofleriaceae bacterium]